MLSFLQHLLQKQPLRGILGILKRNKITQGLGMPVGEGGWGSGGLFFGKVAGFKPVTFLENGLLCGWLLLFFLEDFA